MRAARKTIAAILFVALLTIVFATSAKSEDTAKAASNATFKNLVVTDMVKVARKDMFEKDNTIVDVGCNQQNETLRNKCIIDKLVIKTITSLKGRKNWYRR